ncbi:helix-turn-helix domain-containing protein [Niveispirillum sp. SYP-B3756]|uniref:helix-turn-helix transcriptional regulator n=1 Tax=Niveispirillum sp. SYP-B3756 TaxID=2662178 RepID=UPI001290D680|nr:helix-turn-helix transcriptional regulator [Niveispirillum sp. SYP-B3756]MQP65834.1 helix-turn-helix domain-containing protein [Niveispirillum sp. SYP-B3756]
MQPIQIANAGLSLLIAAQALFLLPVLLGRPERRSGTNRWLAALLGVFALNNMLDIFGTLSGVEDYPAMTAVSVVLIALMGPLALRHIETALPGRCPERPLRTWAPVLLMALLIMPWLFLTKAEMDRAATADVTVTPLLLASGIGVMLCLPLLVGHLGLCLWRAVQVTRQAAAAATGLDAARLAWLSLLTRGILGMWAVFVCSLVLTLLGLEQVVELLANVAYLVVIYGLSILALGRPEVFTPPREAGEKVMAFLAAPVAKYRKSALTPDDIARLLGKADHAMGQRALWRESGLTLPVLARHIGASVNDLSQALNEGRQVNFFDYVNGFRVEAVKQALSDPGMAGRPVLDLALDAGFNSKSAFNAAFKKLTGQTPSAYRAATAPG